MMPSETMIQVPDTDAEVMTADVFRREMNRPVRSRPACSAIGRSRR